MKLIKDHSPKDTCTFDAKNKIHLGIGHIWMSPNDQYLCIVPDYRLVHVSLHHVFLPFDDDQMLSLILSKILLLTEDDKIKDELILKQF